MPDSNRKKVEAMLENQRQLIAVLPIFIQERVLFKELINISLGQNKPKAWKAVRLLLYTMRKDDILIKSRMDDILLNLPTFRAGSQREWIKIIDKMTLNEDQNNQVYQHCMNIWQDVSQLGSLRITAFKMMWKIAHHYPELMDELKLFASFQYTSSLTKGIKKSFDNIMLKSKRIKN